MIFEMMVDKGGCLEVFDCDFQKGAPNKLIADFTGNDVAGLTYGSVMS
jgi:hypothetical protein